ncbi:MAG: hypothetical protein D6708_11360, partial [Candidatus Dadabacteria bacterium]
MREGLRKSATSLAILAKVLLPAYVVVDLLARTPVLPWLAGALAPAMGWLGLPGEAALPLVAGMSVNLYAAIGAMAPLHLTPREITILGLVLGLSHALVIETAVIRQVCPRWLLLAAARVGLGL